MNISSIITWFPVPVCYITLYSSFYMYKLKKNIIFSFIYFYRSNNVLYTYFSTFLELYNNLRHSSKFRKNLNYCYIINVRLNTRSQYKKKIQQRGTHMAFACVCGQKMASMEEDNKRQSDLSITFQGGKNLLSVYKVMHFK